MTTPNETLEALRDEHALLCERYALSLERIGGDGGVEQFDTHQVTFGAHIMLGQAITTVGVGLRDASIPRLHALGEVTLSPDQQQRVAILFCSARLITEVYGSETARAALRGQSLCLPDGTATSPLIAIAEDNIASLRHRDSQLHPWMAKLLTRVLGDPYYVRPTNLR